MRDNRLVLWALVVSLFLHLGFIIYSQQVAIAVGPSSHNAELFRIIFVDSEIPSQQLRAFKTAPREPKEIFENDPVEPVPTPKVEPPEMDASDLPSPHVPPGGGVDVPDPGELTEPDAPVPTMYVEADERTLRDSLRGDLSADPRSRQQGVDPAAKPKVVAPRPASAPPPLPSAPSAALVGLELSGPLESTAPQIEEIELEAPDLRPPDEQRNTLAPDEVEAIQSKNIQDIEQYLDFHLETYHDASGQGYFRITIAPNSKALELPVLRKDIVFAVDASESIGNLTFPRLQDGVEYCIQRLRPYDRFNLVGFETDVTKFAEGLVPATDANKVAALRVLKRFRKSGRTNIYQALVPISQVGGGFNHPFVVLLFSDGRPNVGITDSRKIINDMSDQLKVNSSVFALGIGNKKNPYLLDLLAMSNKGQAFFADSDREVEHAVEQVYNRVSDPLMINVDYTGELGADVLPRRLPDLYRNGALELVGRMGNEKRIVLRLVGQFGVGQRAAMWVQDYPAKDNGTVRVAERFGYFRIYQIIREMTERGETEALRRELRETSQLFGIPVPYYFE